MIHFHATFIFRGQDEEKRKSVCSPDGFRSFYFFLEAEVFGFVITCV